MSGVLSETVARSNVRIIDTHAFTPTAGSRRHLPRIPKDARRPRGRGTRM